MEEKNIDNAQQKIDVDDEVKALNQNENKIKSKNKSSADFWYGVSLFGRIVFTLYSLHGLFFIYNFVIQYIIIFPSLLYKNQMTPGGAAIFSLIYLLFAINSSNLLVIPTFEFFSFPFLFYKQPFAHIISFIYLFKKKKYNDEDVKNNHNVATMIIFSVIIVIEIWYTLGLLGVYLFKNVDIKDTCKMVILIITYIDYIIIILSYFSFSCYIVFIIMRNICKKKSIRVILREHFEEREISNLNLYSNILNPILNKNYKKIKNEKKEEFEIYQEKKDFKCCCFKCDCECLFENVCFEIVAYLKIATLIFSIVCFILMTVWKVLNTWYDYIAFILLYIIMTILSMTLNFPFCCRNRKTIGTWGCFCCFNEKNNFIGSEYEYTGKSLHSNIVSFARCVSNAVITVAAIAFPVIYFSNIQTSKMRYRTFLNIKPSKTQIDSKNKLLPNVCYSSIHNMPLPLFFPFINDAYYYDNINSEDEDEPKVRSSFEIEEYAKLFFDEDYEVDVLGNLVENKNSVTMIQYNVKNKRNYLTILAIKGTSLSEDMYIDAQLYVSSIFLSILSAFSLSSSQKDSRSFSLIEYSLNIPYRIFFRFLIIDTYLEELKNAFISHEYSFYKNVVIVGHSLGGGLAKLFGRFIGKQAISLSGPGVNAFHSLWKYDKESENYEISAIDLVPDMDLVPRVEVSGGTIYRIVCKKGVFACHGKELSLCEMLIMCRNPIYKSYCENVAGVYYNDIIKIEQSSELNE